MRVALSFAFGLIFGLGLCVSGMTQPSKVQGFLDLAGLWDPSLLFVMAGAVAVGFVAFRCVSHLDQSLIGDPIQRSSSTAIDPPLLVGAAIFGAGWGLSGVCPGPSVVNLSSLDTHAIVFFTAMIIGMALKWLAGGAVAMRFPVRQDA